jgi:hypothetical protein
VENVEVWQEPRNTTLAASISDKLSDRRSKKGSHLVSRIDDDGLCNNVSCLLPAFLYYIVFTTNAMKSPTLLLFFRVLPPARLHSILSFLLRLSSRAVVIEEIQEETQVKVGAV